MALEHYIASLLYRYNCVIVPGFGAFLTQQSPARLKEDDHSFFPPSKTVSFNAQLQSNDGLLVAHMAKREKLPYDEVLEKVTAMAEEWTSELRSGARLALEGIGSLRLNPEKNIVFQPDERANYLTSSFGLASFTSVPLLREALKNDVETIEERIPFQFTPEKRKKSGSSIRPYLKYAAILLLAFASGTTAYRFFENSRRVETLVQQEAQQNVTKRIQEATFFDTAPPELPAVTVDVAVSQPAEIKRHHVIAGVFRYKANADLKMEQLREKGYSPSYLGTNEYGLHMVSFESFTDSRDALDALHEIRRSQPDAWLKSEK